MKDADILDFVRNSIGSVWALEMLLLVGSRPERAWQRDELVRELRSSPAAVAGAASLLERARLMAKVGEHRWRYRPASPEFDHVGELVCKIYAAKPATVIGAIFESSDAKLRGFAEAFRFKESRRVHSRVFGAGDHGVRVVLCNQRAMRRTIGA